MTVFKIDCNQQSKLFLAEFNSIQPSGVQVKTISCPGWFGALKGRLLCPRATSRKSCGMPKAVILNTLTGSFNIHQDLLSKAMAATGRPMKMSIWLHWHYVSGWASTTWRYRQKLILMPMKIHWTGSGSCPWKRILCMKPISQNMQMRRNWRWCLMIYKRSTTVVSSMCSWISLSSVTFR